MADEAAIVEDGVRPAQSPLVEVSFQKNVQRIQKYLEAEPKALGVDHIHHQLGQKNMKTLMITHCDSGLSVYGMVTQISLSVFQIVCVAVFLAKGLSHIGIDIPFFISSLLVVIAGSVAVAAQNLHLPTLRACLGMQIVASGASLYNMICCLIKMGDSPIYCWHYHYDNSTLRFGEICHNIENIRSHFFVESVLIQAALLAISVTLATYCCKVVNCCSPAPKMTVITVQTPAVQQ